ncbi:hypothetical protein SDC9_156247 [bioreactor metagenome]|uniref:Uncharacterized protein n=1 Tax=bioreactor metagenome TaxID=1076179 RepID=A0A645F6A4_9ZZZZ
MIWIDFADDLVNTAHGLHRITEYFGLVTKEPCEQSRSLHFVGNVLADQLFVFRGHNQLFFQLPHGVIMRKIGVDKLNTVTSLPPINGNITSGENIFLRSPLDKRKKTFPIRHKSTILVQPYFTGKRGELSQFMDGFFVYPIGGIS